MIEVEGVRQVQFPKARFENPISAAIFFYGFTEEDAPPQGQPAPEDPLLPVVGLRTDITFPGIPLNVSKEVRASVARLHVNAGHPSKQELKRLLAAHGALNLPVVTALEHIKCGSCERTAKHLQPRPAALPTFQGQFAERLQADLVYIRDLSGTNHAVFGAVCMATNLQQAGRLLSRAPNHVLDVLRQIWLGPFGYPLQIEVDPDGAFQKEFTEQLESAGVHVNTIPAEAHWRIGAIERRNALLRTVVERLVDENAVTSGEALDWVITAATQTLNASVSTKGRSPYQAAFGKLPRFPGYILNDDRSLIVHNGHLLAEELRSQALRAVADAKASSTIRRALLRKTAPNVSDAKAILPGAMAAYWRWTKKAAGKKRGGYVLGRLVHHDSDGKSAWVHSNGGLVQVTHEQLRPAYGLEDWAPGPEDIRALKDGAKRLREGVWTDERGPGPGEDENLDPEIDAMGIEEPTQPFLAPPPVELPHAPQALQVPQAPPALASAAVPPPQLPQVAMQQVEETTNVIQQQQVFSPTLHQHHIERHYDLPQGATSSATRRRSRSPRSQPSQQHSLPTSLSSSSRWAHCHNQRAAFPQP